MSRPVYFSFDFDHDRHRASLVAEQWGLIPYAVVKGLFEPEAIEKAKKKGLDAMRWLIDAELKEAAITAVLIGERSYKHPWVRYAIASSVKKGLGLVGIAVHGIKDEMGNKGQPGANPFSFFQSMDKDGREGKLSEFIPIFDWVQGDGPAYLTQWLVKEAVVACQSAAGISWTDEESGKSDDPARRKGIDIIV